MKRSINQLLLFTLLSTTLNLTSLAQDFKSCGDIKGYLDSRKNSQDTYNQRLSFEEAVKTLESINENVQNKCDDSLTDRFLLEYAQTVDRYSQEEKNGWFLKAAGLYKKYIEWFLDLPADRQDKIIRDQTSDSKNGNFEEVRNNRIRARIGGAVAAMGDAYIRAGQQNDLLDEYENLFTNSKNLLLFPAPVVKDRWYKCLRSQPEFRSDDYPDDKISEIIKKCDPCKNHWSSFGDFLQVYIPRIQEGRIKNGWQDKQKAIDKWLAP